MASIIVDSPEILRDKQRIMMNQPHLVQIKSCDRMTCNIAEPQIKGLKLYFDPRIYGSGTPSPTNKLQFGGLTSLSINIGNKTITKDVSNVTARYHGYYDADSGLYYEDYTSQTITSGLSSYSTTGSSSIFWGYAGNTIIYNDPWVQLWSNMFTFVGSHYKYGDVPDYSFAAASAYPNSFWVKVPTSILPANSLDGAKQWVEANPIQIVAPRKAGPITTDVGSLVVNANRGQQEISTTGQNATVSFDLSYWTNIDNANQLSYGGIPVYINNAGYIATDGPAGDNIYNEDFFITLIDTGTTASKSVTFSRYAENIVDDKPAYLRVFNDLSSSSFDYWGISLASLTPRTVTINGRYILMPIPKKKAAYMYMYTTSGGTTTWLLKGSSIS